MPALEYALQPGECLSLTLSLSLSLVFQVLRREYEIGKKVWQLQIGF